jgi:hypothetical protein
MAATAVSSRLNVAAVKQFLGDVWRKFETASITTIIRIVMRKLFPRIGAG